MTELKTLKDLEVCGCCQVEDQQEYGCMKNELRQEAIKWVNRIYDKDISMHFLETGYFIKHFFNLTEEDLK